MNGMDIHQILELLPHRYPFLLVDRVLECEPGKRLVVCTGMIGCSAHQNDSKPSASAVRAMKATSTL